MKQREVETARKEDNHPVMRDRFIFPTFQPRGREGSCATLVPGDLRQRCRQRRWAGRAGWARKATEPPDQQDRPCPAGPPVLGAAGTTHQHGHLHDVGRLQELRVHSRPGLEQHASVPGVVGAELPGHQRQACKVKARGSLRAREAPEAAPRLFQAYQLLPTDSGPTYPQATGSFFSQCPEL